MKTVLLLIAFVLGEIHFAEGQQGGKLYRIGYLGIRSGSPTTDAEREVFRQELRKFGYVEGQTIAIEYRFAEGNPDRVPDLAADLVRLNVDVIVTPASVAIRAAKQATPTIPIVMAGARVDPVAAGFVASLARPGGNITGLTSMDSDLHGKRLELLKQVSSRISNVAVLSGRLLEQDMKEIETVGRALGIQIRFLLARNLDDLENAFSAISKNPPNALLVAASPAILDQQAKITNFATKKRLLTVYDRSQFIEAGGIMSYGVDQADLFRRATVFVDKILKGAKPDDLPVEQPTKFELIINLKAAKKIGLPIPPQVLARADRVIK